MTIDSPAPWVLECPRILQSVFHPRPTLSRGFLGCARAAPVRFQAYAELVSVVLQRGELPSPINQPAAHRRPFVILAISFFRDVFAVAMPNPLFRQQRISIRVGSLSARGSVAWIPVQQEILRFHCIKDFRRFHCRGRVARRFVFEQQRHALLPCQQRIREQPFVHSRSKRRRLFKTPKIEAAYAVRLKRFRQRDASVEDLTLLSKCEISVELCRL